MKGKREDSRVGGVFRRRGVLANTEEERAKNESSVQTLSEKVPPLKEAGAIEQKVEDRQVGALKAETTGVVPAAVEPLTAAPLPEMEVKSVRQRKVGVWGNDIF